MTADRGEHVATCHACRRRAVVVASSALAAEELVRRGWAWWPPAWYCRACFPAVRVEMPQRWGPE